ncbi:3-alpha,7-alpha,12-alpha-trihydroxy-5-beta-cholest-24-enoyl-CoA hydratase [Pseudoroseomonas rhizosphaerae]|uniref:3-alpha,7-alpha, 12-alpha-trihydroxy-5-beta-cholest-24-enoyl-CoA hydratase n=1 Tax=Teichococcus rhizosphaerae TaxID=1335062 RepID=A0A2C7AC65_9PROT|nr:MaoC/PaaZ C-terminal domain-containing protein [Pseudoroseomonas rhizosphaerae]PHK94247.1 3-alpha,7-alpha,12-alpha-trihydroxy-5-beta-cholest-24-enoyl-CoA hydratase [Pseudoroseomonas rhizosphaerae]
MINHEKLLNFPIPEVRQRVRPQDAVFYALSVGMGQDPMDTRQLPYITTQKGPVVMPAMAVVLGHPGFWLGNPETGVDAVRLVHGEQRITLHRPLPADGEVIGRTRVTGIVDKGEGKGALLYSEKEITDAATGELLAVTGSTTFLRADGGFGGPSGPVIPPNPMPEGAPDIVLDLPTRPEQAFYYRLNGDDNPLHTDPEVAARAGFPRPILHGLCTLGVVTHAILRELCDYRAEALKGLSLRFSSPVYPGETIRAEIWRSGAFRARVVERDVVVVNNGAAVLA